MNHRIKRAISLLLLLLLAVNAVACGETPADPSAGDQTLPATTVAEETETSEVPGPEKTDLEGYSLRVITTSWVNCDKMICAESFNGDVINDTMFEAQGMVMNDYNCTYEFIVYDSPYEVSDNIRKTAQSQADEYDVSYSHDTMTVAGALGGYYFDLRDCNVFNYDAPWWNRETLENFTVGGQMYFASNYLTYSPLYCGCVLVYNKELADEYKLEIPYEDILAGNWYMEDLISMAQVGHRDLNGDGKITLGEDQIGFVTSDAGMANFRVSMGSKILGKDDEGYMALTIDEEHSLMILDAFERLMEYGADSEDASEYGAGYFKDGNVLFDYLQVRNIPETVQHSDVRFGVLPVPKLNKNQENYISGAFDVYWGIPTTAYANSEKIATILEATAHNCYYSVLPTVYETAMKVKFSESVIDAEMFDLIRNSMCVDAAYAFNQQNTALSDMVYMLYRLDSGNFSSKLASLRKPLTRGIEKINGIYEKLVESE